MVEALGHNVPLRVHAGVRRAAARWPALAGVIGGTALRDAASMAASLGRILFVVVVIGGLGSLPGAFIASLLIGLLQTFAVAVNCRWPTCLAPAGRHAAPGLVGWRPVAVHRVAQVAPMLPYLLLVLMLIFRPTGLWLGRPRDMSDAASDSRRGGAGRIDQRLRARVVWRRRGRMLLVLLPLAFTPAVR